MTDSLHQELREIADNISGDTKVSDSDINSFWEVSLYHGRIQKDLIKAGFENEEVVSFEAFNEKTNEFDIYSVKASQKLTRKQYFKIEVCQSLNLSRDKINEIVKA